MRVALVDDYEVVVQGVAAMLRSYRNRVEVVEFDLNRDPGEAVDITLYETFANSPGDGEDVRRLAAAPSAGKVVVYSWNTDADLVAAALSNGASAYLSKGLSAGRLVEALEALEAIHRGGQPPPAAGGNVTATVVGGDWPGREEGLTQREAEVLALITQGLDNAAIAEQTRLSINSVKTYISSCYRRIGASNRTRAILWGIEHGFRPDRQRLAAQPAPKTH
ncbi:response regulator transcription factor [Sinomonas atrocyanea]